MRSVLETCKPRPEILAGTFNPEVFTASLSPIIEFYRSGKRAVDSIYTDAQLFFREATYPTQGLRLTLAEVFGRIAGDMTVPAIHRLETAFGGGKTHTLVACTHIAHRGTELASAVQDILDPGLLPQPGSVAVVGVAGDEIPVHKPKGDALVPYTLWGEIAYQIGGERLYQEVEDEASSFAAPGRTYFDKVLGNRKVLIMLDELAQYAARLEAARPDGANQLAAFLMALNGYVRNHAGMAVVLTLASAADAFSRQTEHLARLISQVRGEEVNEDDALGIGERAVRGVASVVARDAVQVTPVQATEISSVLAKRLFTTIDREAAKAVAGAYMEMYQRNASWLPEEASREDFRGRLVANYPFHPTLVDFLNKKLASAENFQGTRGVLRVLALAVRTLWHKHQEVPMIHACHLDLRSERVVNEILGRTGSSDLMLVLNADIGSVDTGSLEGGQSNAELADQRNPHPEGHPLYEYTWKTVFLHSLVGREEGLGSRIFGLTESEALLSVSFPGLTPPQVRTALEEINQSAFYLRYEQGRYFASEEPTINVILARIRRTLQAKDVEGLLAATARKLLSAGSTLFHIENDVSLPEHLPDSQDKLVLGVVSLTAGSIDIEAMVTTKGPNRPREQQNLVFLLVPETVSVKGLNPQEELFASPSPQAQEKLDHLQSIARDVKAIQKLVSDPHKYGVNPSRLQAEDFVRRRSDRELALNTAVAGVYTSLYYPGASGHMVRKEIKTAGGEGGAPFIEQIRKTLISDGELLTSENTTQSDLVNLSNLFFELGDTITLNRIRQNFSCLRSWPVLESPGVFDRIIRAGVEKGAWCLYRLEAEDSARPSELYDQKRPVPMAVDLTQPGYGLVTPSGAAQRGWTETEKVDPTRMGEAVIYRIESSGPATAEQVREEIAQQYGEVSPQDWQDTIITMLKKGQLYAYRGELHQEEKPELIYGPAATLYSPAPEDVLITPAQAARRGWTTTPHQPFRLTGRDGAKKILPLLRRLGGIYDRGATSTITSLDLVDLELPYGGKLRLQLTEVPPDSMRSLGELFETLDGLVQLGDGTEADLEIDEPDDNCLLIKELKSAQEPTKPAGEV